mgnify:CR=1 FL=1
MPNTPASQADLVAERLGRRGSNPQIPGLIPGSVRSLLPLKNGTEGRTSHWHVCMCCHPVCMGGD